MNVFKEWQKHKSNLGNQKQSIWNVAGAKFRLLEENYQRFHQYYNCGNQSFVTVWMKQVFCTAEYELALGNIPIRTDDAFQSNFIHTVCV